MRPWLSWFCNNSMFCRPVTEGKILTNVTPSLTQPNRSSASVYPLCAVYRPFGHLTAGFFFIAKHPQLFLSLAKSERKYLTSKFLGTNQIPVVRVVEAALRWVITLDEKQTALWILLLQKKKFFSLPSSYFGLKLICRHLDTLLISHWDIMAHSILIWQIASPSQAQHRRDIHPFMLEFVNLESPNSLTWLTLDCWGKSEYLERIHAGKLLVVFALGSVSVSPKFAHEAQQWSLSPVTVQDNGVWVCLTGWR